MTATTLSLDHGQVVTMLREMGFQTADRFDDKRLLKKLKDLPALMSDDVDKQEEPETEESRCLLAEILQAIENGDDLEIEAHASNGTAKGQKAGKGAKAVKGAKASKEKASKPPKVVKVPKEKRPPKEKIGTDKFGSRFGSKNAQLNKQLTGKWKTMAQLVADAGLEGTHYNHFKKLLEAKNPLVEKSAEGYRLKK